MAEGLGALPARVGPLARVHAVVLDACRAVTAGLAARRHLALLSRRFSVAHLPSSQLLPLWVRSTCGVLALQEPLAELGEQGLDSSLPQTHCPAAPAQA